MNNPAIDEAGNKYWRNEKGELHREDGPAKENADGEKEWWVNNKLHRLDGPALEGPTGDDLWFIEGQEYTEEEYNKKIIEMKVQNPEINKDGTKYWYNEKREFHRLDGPAVEYVDGFKSYWIEGIRYTEEWFNKKIGKKEKPTMKDIMKDRFEQAAYRSASRQIVNGISKAIMIAAEKKGMDSFTAAAVGKFFETELGAALIGAMLGVGIPYIPKINKDKRALKLAEEFQIESMATVTDTVLNEIFTYILPVVSEVLNTLPIRVENESEEEIINSERVKHAHISDH